MTEFDHLRFDIQLAIPLDTSVPRPKQERGEWAEKVSERIAERLRKHWEFTRKPGIDLGPSFSSGMGLKKDLRVPLGFSLSRAPDLDP
jgi:hypothetical protein